MNENTKPKDKKTKKLFVRGLVEGEGGRTDKKSLEADPSHLTTLIVGEEGY